MKILHFRTNGKWIRLLENGHVTILRSRVFRNHQNRKSWNGAARPLSLTSKGMFLKWFVNTLWLADKNRSDWKLFKNTKRPIIIKKKWDQSDSESDIDLSPPRNHFTKPFYPNSLLKFWRATASKFMRQFQSGPKVSSKLVPIFNFSALLKIRTKKTGPKIRITCRTKWNLDSPIPMMHQTDSNRRSGFPCQYLKKVLVKYWKDISGMWIGFRLSKESQNWNRNRNHFWTKV